MCCLQQVCTSCGAAPPRWSDFAVQASVASPATPWARRGVEVWFGDRRRLLVRCALRARCALFEPAPTACIVPVVVAAGVFVVVLLCFGVPRAFRRVIDDRLVVQSAVCRRCTSSRRHTRSMQRWLPQLHAWWQPAALCCRCFRAASTWGSSCAPCCERALGGPPLLGAACCWCRVVPFIQSGPGPPIGGLGRGGPPPLLCPLQSF
jgi:hypothetical protein